MSPSPASARPDEEALRRLLGTAARRLALRHGLRRSGGGFLAALLALEAGWLLSALLPWAPGVGTAIGGGCALFGLVRLLRTPWPSAVLAAEVLDALLGSGAAVASGAEALAGGHARFRRALLREASRRLEGLRLGELLPLRAPPGMLLATGAALLLPFVVPDLGEAGPAEARAPRLRSLLEAPAAGAGAEEGSGEPVALGAGEWLFAPVPGAEAPRPEDALPLDLADALRSELGAILAELPPATGTGTGAAEATGGAVDPASADRARGEAEALVEAFAAGDSETARATLERLARRARAGDGAAARALAGLADGLAPPGAGPSEAAPDRSPPASGAPKAASEAPTRGRREALPWALEEARRRYFRS
ncbi:MAG: hypothetical protein D6731_00445 [Planctomycetota bacterium]|nr:MAG: hypothetical protein D6731_00445 [Planctomycetota bacterium]